MEHFLYDTHTIRNTYTHFFKPLYDSLRGSVWIWLHCKLRCIQFWVTPNLRCTPISSNEEDDLKKQLYIYNIVMSYIEEVSRMSKSGHSDIELLEYIDEHFNKIEYELNGEEYKEPKHYRNLCIDCNVVKTIDYERSTLVCTKCGLCEYYPIYVVSYNHTMQPSRRKCIYKRSDNFKVILNQFFFCRKRVVPDDIMETIRREIHDGTNILYPYEIPQRFQYLNVY